MKKILFQSTLFLVCIFYINISQSTKDEYLREFNNEADTLGDNCSVSHEIEHTRHKRQLPLMFPEGGTSKLLIGFAMPIDNPIKLNLIFALNFQYQYAVPPNISFFTRYYPFVNVGRKKRSHEFNERTVFYTALEKTMDGMGYDGHSCLLRTICEAAEAPVHHNGLVGEVLQVILTPPYEEDKSSEIKNVIDEDIYVAARKAGEQLYDCKQLYPSCPLGHGLFDMISHLE